MLDVKLDHMHGPHKKSFRVVLGMKPQDPKRAIQEETTHSVRTEGALSARRV